MDLTKLSRIEARCPQARKAYALYGREWEVCVGSHGMSEADAAELLSEWRKDDPLYESFRNIPEYRYVPGRVLTDAECTALLQLESERGHATTDEEFAAWVETLPEVAQ